MERSKLLKLSLWTLITALLLFVISYFFFHFVTDSGISLEWHPEAGKPYVSNLLGGFAELFLFASVLTFMIAQIWCPKEGK